MSSAPYMQLGNMSTREQLHHTMSVEINETAAARVVDFIERIHYY